MNRTIAAMMLSAIAAVGLPFLHPFGNPHTRAARGLGTLLQAANMPAGARLVLVNKCANCHSSETRWPVYAHVAPASWLIERDIVEARKKMDLSRWEEMSPDARDRTIAKIVHEAKSGAMPPPQYLALHWNSRLTSADVAALSVIGNAVQDDAASRVLGDAVSGKAVFEKRCTGCHAMDADREGPRLSGVFGRKAGGVAGFKYSVELKNSGIAWNEATLERWLRGPELMVPDTNMDFRVPKAQERADLIAYFKVQPLKGSW